MQENAEKEKTGGFRRQRMTFLLISLATGVFFALVVGLMCRHGAEVPFVDSLNYFRFSETGDWHDLPVIHGIGYAVFLSVFEKLAPSLQVATAMANVLAGFLFASLLCFIAVRRFGWKGMGVAWAVLGNFAVLEDYGAALSEGIFLVGLLGAFAGITMHRKTGKRRWLTVSAVFMAFSCVTRYAGLAFAGIACLVLWLGADNRTKGFVKACAYGLTSVLPLTVIMTVNHLLRGNATAHSAGFHPVGLNEWGDACATISSWLVPDRVWLAVPFLSTAIGLTVLVGCLVLGIRGVVKRDGETMIWTFAALGHVMFLALSYTFVDCDLAFNRRLLSPMIPFLFWGLACLLEHEPRIGRTMFIVMFAYLMCFNAYRAVPLVHERFENGAGWWGKRWEQSPVVGIIVELSRRMPVYSNASAPLGFRGCANIHGIPWVELPTSGTENDGFMEDYAACLSSLENGSAVLAKVNFTTWFKRMVQLEQIVADAGLEKLVECEDGTIWGKPDSLDGK